MVQKDAVLAGYKERIERAMQEEEKDCNKWKVYLGRQQAHMEWEKVVEEHRADEEEARRIMAAFFRGRDLVYCDRSVN